MLFRIVFISIVLVVLCPLLLASNFSSQSVCQGVKIISSNEGVRFTETEKILICDGYGKKPYNNSPVNQRQFFLTKFLEARGYFFPKIEIRDNSLIVGLGSISTIKRIQIENDPIGINTSKLWKIWGMPLTTKALDYLENWVAWKLAEFGYPCIELNTTASAIDGTVTIELTNSSQVKFGDTKFEKDRNSLGNWPKRYLAYNNDQIYRESLLDITTKRLKKSRRVINASYFYDCQIPDMDNRLKISFISGLPRLASVGIGFDTEEYFLFDTTLENSRLGEFASSYLAALSISYRHQQLFLSNQWFYSPIPASHSIKTETSLNRFYEKEYESFDLNMRTGPNWQFDYDTYFIDLWIYLQYQYSYGLRGFGQKSLRSIPAVFRLDMVSHNYELSSEEPTNGSLFSLKIANSVAEMGSDYSETNIYLSMTKLFNLFDYDPAIWIFGIRGQLEFIDLHRDESSVQEYPSFKKIRLGGSGNLRGFARKSVPNSGAFSSFYLGLELRMAEIFPYGIQPIIFFDHGRIGYRSYSFRNTRFWSPGIGLNWQSFIGTFRGSLAYGYATGEEKENYQPSQPFFLYLSYGEYF